MSEDEALDETTTVRWDDAIHEIKLHGLHAWKQNDAIYVEDEEREPWIVVDIVNGMVQTAPIMKFLGY
tara:strand:- start:24 stop:227 length:204 start_codon:yes stop_codon:yes gene_type:complete